MHKRLFTLLLFFNFLSVFAQNEVVSKSKKSKGAFYISWGYNREKYTRSDIHIKNTKTDNYDFILKNAAAHDRPEFNKGFKNFIHTDLSIPQYNFHFGYLFKDKRNLGIELSWDHLKYIVFDNIDIHVQGNVRGHQIDKDTLVSSDFVHIQHTNGNNYLMLNIVKFKTLYKNRFVELNAIGKAGIGPLVSVSITTIFGQHRNTHFLPQGFVTGGTLGARLNLFKYLFIQPSFQIAWADYLATPIGIDGIGRVKQNFASYTIIVEGGFNIPLSH